jgi:hypothetical protein
MTYRDYSTPRTSYAREVRPLPRDPGSPFQTFKPRSSWDALGKLAICVFGFGSLCVFAVCLAAIFRSQ